MNTRAYSVRSQAVSTVKKSQAMMPSACARRNSVQDGPVRLGAGPSRAVRSRVRIVVAATRMPSLRSSPSIRTHPHRGFSRARRRMSSRIAASIGGRPGRPVLRSVHFLLPSSRCQRGRVAGVTRKATQRSRGMTRLAAARRTCVDGPELAWARRPLQHPELMAEDEDLEVLASVVSALLATADEETDEGADDEVEEGQHRPIVPGLSERESGFPTPMTRSEVTEVTGVPR